MYHPIYTPRINEAHYGVQLWETDTSKALVAGTESTYMLIRRSISAEDITIQVLYDSLYQLVS